MTLITFSTGACINGDSIIIISGVRKVLKQNFTGHCDITFAHEYPYQL